ncbi:MAG: hypothetical protein M3Q10_08280 [Chloroflexota bacterium]|nr:hypothetical protein [Chloroflexota bacterium]
MTTKNQVAEALVNTLVSPNESDRNMEAANVVDGLFAVARAIDHLANQVKWLGTGDAGTTMGAVEFLAVSVREGMGEVASSLNEGLREMAHSNERYPLSLSTYKDKRAMDSNPYGRLPRILARQAHHDIGAALAAGRIGAEEAGQHHLWVAEAVARWEAECDALAVPEPPPVAERLAAAIASVPADCTHLTHEVVIPRVRERYETNDESRPRDRAEQARHEEFLAAGYRFVGSYFDDSLDDDNDSEFVARADRYRIEVDVVRNEP